MGEDVTDESPPAAVALAYLASFAGRDPDTIAGHVSEGFVNAHASALGSGCTGRDEYVRRLPGFLERFPGLAYHVERVIADGPHVAVSYRLTATSEDHPIEVRGVMVFEVGDGLIAERTDYWDSLGYLRQIDQVDDVSGR
jgi:ketosteroid isomerase-like protein